MYSADAPSSLLKRIGEFKIAIFCSRAIEDSEYGETTESDSNRSANRTRLILQSLDIILDDLVTVLCYRLGQFFVFAIFRHDKERAIEC